MRRSRNSERDFRNFLKIGSLDVRGYIGVSSYKSDERATSNTDTRYSPSSEVR